MLCPGYTIILSQFVSYLNVCLLSVWYVYSDDRDTKFGKWFINRELVW